MSGQNHTLSEVAPRTNRNFSELVSVIIPCRNQAHFLAEAIESALGQTHPHVEVIVVNDGSTDNTSAVAARYPSVRYISVDNSNVAAARNLALGLARGNDLVFLDADDLLHPRCIASGLECLRRHPEAAFACGRYRLVHMVEGTIQTPEKPPLRDDQYEWMFTNPIGMLATVIFRRSVLERVRGFDESYSAAEDLELYIRIVRKFPITFHTEVVADYRLHSTNMSNRSDRQLRNVMRVMRAQLRHTRRHRRLRIARRRAKRIWQYVYGGPLVNEVEMQVRDRRWGLAVQGLAVLSMHHPRGLIAVFRMRSYRAPETLSVDP